MGSRRILPLVIAALLAAASSAGANTYTAVIDHGVSWSQAQTAATLAGGTLATITSASEQAAVEAAIATAAPSQNGGFWINLRETTECCYVWDDGEASCYANFYPAEPNNGAPGERRGQVMWNISDPTRRGFWNDVPPGGISGTDDYSRGGYVIEFGPPDAAGGPCGACIRVSPTSSCNTPPGFAVVTLTQVTGVSTAPPLGTAAVRTIQRTIIDAGPQPSPGRLRPWQPQATITVDLPVPAAGVTAKQVVAAFIDSLNRVAGGAGFVANYRNPPDSTVFQMYRVGPYDASDTNNVPGITVQPYTAAGTPDPAPVTTLAFTRLGA